MTQVLQHDYGKGRVTLREIRAAIKAVKAARSAAVMVGKESGSTVEKGASTPQSRQGA